MYFASSPQGSVLFLFPNNLLHTLMSFFFFLIWIMHIRESTVWLSSLNTMTSSSIHFLADDIVLFFMAGSEALLCSSPFLYPFIWWWARRLVLLLGC